MTSTTKRVNALILQPIKEILSLSSWYKKDLIMGFVDRVSADGEIDEVWRAYVEAQRSVEREAIIAEEYLKTRETETFIERAFRGGSIPFSSTGVTEIFPPASRFSANGGNNEKKQCVLHRLGEFFNRFFGLSAQGGEE